MKRGRVTFYLLFATYLLLQTVVLLQTRQVAFVASWPRHFHEAAEIILTVLLLLLLTKAESGHRDLEHAIKRAATGSDALDATIVEATSATAGLQSSLAEVGNTAALAREVKKDVEDLRREVRSDDTVLHGKLLFFEKRYADAAALFSEAVAADPPNPRTRYWLGLSYLRNRDAARALVHLEFALSNSQDPEYLRALGEAELRLGRFDGAATHLASAVERGVRSREETQLLLASAQAETAPSKAEVTLKQVIEKNPYNGKALEALAGLLRNQGRHDEGIRLCDEAVVRNPRNWTVYASRAELLLRRDAPADREAAKKDLDLARSENPRDFNLYRIEGRLWLSQALEAETQENRRALLEKAVDAYRSGIELVPANYRAPLYAAQSFAFLLLGRPDDAERAAAIAVDNNPGHIQNHLALWSALAANRRWPAAQRAARKAREVDSDAARPERKILSCLLEVVAALCSGELARDLIQETRILAAELRATPSFVPSVRSWQYVRGAVADRSKALDGSERSMLNSCMDFLDRKVELAEFVGTAERIYE